MLAWIYGDTAKVQRGSEDVIVQDSANSKPKEGGMNNKPRRRSGRRSEEAGIEDLQGGMCARAAGSDACGSKALPKQYIKRDDDK